MRPPHLAFWALIALCASCASEADSRPQSPVQAADPAPELRAQRALALAQRLFAEGQPREAMMELDTALQLDSALQLESERVLVQFLRGECALRLGTEDGNPFFFEDARAAFLEAAESGLAPAAWFGAARATWSLYFQSDDPGQLEEALDYARSGLAERGAGRDLEQHFADSPERTLAQIHFSAYSAAKTGVLPESQVAFLFEATRDALEAVIGLDPTDGWGWGQLANLYLWEGRREDARTTLASGVDLAPEDLALHESQARLIQEDGGWESVLSLYEGFSREHDGLAVGHFWRGRALYELALANLSAQQGDPSAAFDLAEEELRRARELDAEFTQACLVYEVICRDGRGWSHYHAGRVDAAEEAFWSMEELFEGGLRWEVANQLRSGLDSLAWIVAAHNDAWERALDESTGATYEECFPHLVKAAELAERLFAYDPESWNHANNAGYFNRDLAVQYESQGVAALEEQAPAAELFGRAVEHMERSYEAYVQAAKLAPEDARTVNDTGLILAYYLQRDLETAERYFEEAIAIGLPQLEAGIEDEVQRTMTREAVGDAYQNLGVVELTLRGDAAAARPHFERSLGYERSPRVEVTRYYLPLCDAVERGEIDAARVLRAHYWKDLEPARVEARLEALRGLRAELTSN
jgi:tetratricopeptide (TPR) repeat protein